MKNKPIWLVVAIVLFLAQGFWEKGALLPYWKENYAQKSRGDLSQLSPDQLLASLAGFREMIAGILWVRADSFFDQGNYDAILPIMRIVTILDPHQIDVYATGMWHIGYNFTDEGSRSDRRYIPSALAFGEEGAKNNPQTYEMFFETGWMWFHKIDDNYGKAVSWLDQANSKKDVQDARRNLYFRALIRDGKVQETADYLYKLLTETENKMKEAEKSGTPDFQLNQIRDTREGNLDNHLVRMVQRGWLAEQRGDSLQPYDVYPPFDVGFTAKVTFTDSRVMHVEGTWNVLPVGTRIRCILRDANYPNAVPGGMDWDKDASVNLDPPTNLTFMQELLFVRDQRFDKVIDMSRDPTMYPFVQDDYVVEFYYNPRSAPDHIQDKFGFNGEGMTDKQFLNTDIREGQKVIFASLKVTKDMILRRGEYEVGEKIPVLTTSGFVEKKATDVRDNVIKVPGLRSEGAANTP